MNWLIKCLSTSIGKKYLMAVTGLLLCGFLIVHLAGNFLLIAGEEAFNSYAHTLHSQEGLLKVAELGLFTLFIVHILLALMVSNSNRQARKHQYQMKVSKQQGPRFKFMDYAENWMMISGLIILVFLILHLSDLTFGLRADLDLADKEPFDRVMTVLKNPISGIVYLVGCSILGIHLSHGVASAFQSVGFNHPRYNMCIRIAGLIFSLVIALGFVGIILWAWLL